MQFGVIMANWTYPITNRLLLDAGAAFGLFYLSQSPSPGTTTNDISVTELSTGLQYNALGGSLFSPVYSTDIVTGLPRNNRSWNLNQKVTLSYITGSHAFKVGVVPAFGFHDQVRSLNQAVTYFFRNQVPASLTQWASPAMLNTRLRTVGYYAQDQWTMKRLTLNLGLRLDTFHAHSLPVDLPPSRFLPARHFDAVDNVPDWKDLNPRFGVAYDLFGTGKTALKVSLGRYVSSMGVTIAEQNNPAQAIVSSTNRTWNDAFFPVGDPRRGNLAPDCDLLSPVGNDECGPMSARNFGTTGIATRYDSDVLTHRDYNWQTSASVQHELSSGVSLNVGYYRTSYGNFRVTDNLAVAPADHSPFCMTVPVDPRLPNGGSQLCGLYDISPTKFGLLDNVITSASHYGKATEVYNGFQGSVNARLGRRGTVSGGISTGQTDFNNCFTVDSPQAMLFCDTKLPWRAQTQVKFNGTYDLPGDVQLAGVFQNLGGGTDCRVVCSDQCTNTRLAGQKPRSMRDSRSLQRHGHDCQPVRAEYAVRGPADAVGCPPREELSIRWRPGACDGGCL